MEKTENIIEKGKKYRFSTVDGVFIDLEILMVKNNVVTYQRPNGTIDQTELETISRLRKKEINEGVKEGESGTHL